MLHLGHTYIFKAALETEYASARSGMLAASSREPSTEVKTRIFFSELFATRAVNPRNNLT